MTRTNTAGFDRVRALQEKWGATILADSLFANQDTLSAAISDAVSADPRATTAARTLKAFFAAHPDANVDVPSPRPDLDLPDHTESLSDIINEQAYGWGDAGFEVGLAIGMLLNPAILGGRR